MFLYTVEQELRATSAKEGGPEKDSQVSSCKYQAKTET